VYLHESLNQEDADASARISSRYLEPQSSPHFSATLRNKRIKKADKLSEKNRRSPD
jgi:hypothetical protein